MADKTYEELVAEVERLRRDNGELTRRWFQQNEWRADAEAKVARVEAHADHLDAVADGRASMIQGYYNQGRPDDALRLETDAWSLRRAATEIRAALADAPAEQRAEGGDAATEGSGCYVASFSEDTCGEHGGEWVYEDDGTTVLPECSRAVEFRADPDEG